MCNHVLYLIPLIALEMLDKEGAIVDTIFCLPSIYVSYPKNSKKYYLFTMGPQKHIDYCGTIHSGIEALKVPFQVKLTKIPLVNPRLTKSQIGSKSSKNNIFHTSISNPSYSVIFINFDPRLTFEGTKNPNYDLTTRTG